MRITARGIVIKDSRVLLMERWRTIPQTGEQLHYFAIPGGQIEPGESPEQAVVREMHEETGLRVQPKQQIAVVTGEHGDQHHIFICTDIGGRLHLPADSPEAQRAAATDQYHPRWLSQQEFAITALHPVYEPIRSHITQLLAHA